MPRAFECVGKVRDLGDVVGNRDRFTSGARKDCKITGRRQVGTKHALPAYLQFDTEQSVLNFRR